MKVAGWVFTLVILQKSQKIWSEGGGIKVKLLKIVF